MVAGAATAAAQDANAGAVGMVECNIGKVRIVALSRKPPAAGICRISGVKGP